MKVIEELRQLLEQASGEIVHAVVLVLVAILVFAVGYRLSVFAQHRTYRFMLRTQPAGGDILARACARVVWMIGVVVSILASLRILGIDFGALMAGLGLSTLVIGVALKDIIEQAIAGTLLLVQHPFRVGDTIQVEGLEGTVVDVAVRTTNLKTADGIHALIPNNRIYQGVIKNKTHYPSRRLTLTFGLGPGCDLAAAHTALLAAVARVPGVLPAPPPVVAFQGWEQEGVRTNVQFWIEMDSDGPTMETAVTQAILDESRRSGLELRSTGQSIVLRQAAG